MTKPLNRNRFAQLFKKYRLHSEIETLSEFGDLLAEEGMVYETSLFTRWQQGDRVPRERKTILAILRVFAKRGSVHSIEEANTFFEAVNQRNMSDSEIEAIQQYLKVKEIKKREKFEDEKQYNNFVSPLKQFVKIQIVTFSHMSPMNKSLILLYALLLLWWFKINFVLKDSNEINLFGALYGLLAFLGAINGFRIAQQVSHKNKLLSKSILFFSLGLLGGWFGQTVWSYYNIIALVEIPYPSLADVGFISAMPFYAFGGIYLGAVSGSKFELKTPKQILTFTLTPILIVLTAYTIFIRHLSFDFSDIRVILDILYAFGQVVAISIVVIGFILSKNINRNRMFPIIFALTFQYITDCIFLYQIANETYHNAGLIDMMLTTAFLIMSVSVQELQYLPYSNKNPSYLYRFTRQQLQKSKDIVVSVRRYIYGVLQQNKNALLMKL